MVSGQVSQGFQKMATKYIGQVFIKANPQGYILPAFVQSQAAYIPTYFRPEYLPPLCDQAPPVQLGQPNLFREVKHVACFLT